MREHRYYVYIMASKSRRLYTGMGNNLRRRVFQHKNDLLDGFTKCYRIHRLVYWESYDNVINAINREKQIKSWRRSKKIALIEKHNPTWEDLAADWFTEQQVPRFARDDMTKGAHG